MRRRWIVSASMVMLAACSGGDQTASTTEPVATVASAPPTTAPQTTEPPATDVTDSTAVPETEPSATTEPPPVETTPPDTAPTETTSPETTTDSAPTTTVGDGDPAAIEAEWREAVRLFRVAQMDPNDMAAVESAIRYRSGDNRIDIGFLLAQMRELGRRILPEPAAPVTLTLEVPPTPADDGSGQFVMTVCEVDAWVLVADDADGAMTVIDDAVVSSRDELRMNFFEGRWTILARQRLESAEGVGLCDA